METASLLVPGAADEAAIVAALQREHLVDGATERQGPFLYFRLPPPARVSWSAELERITGDLEPEPGALWVTHPFECWIAGPLHLAERARDHAVLPARVVDSTGDPVDEHGVEVRTLPANAPYLVLALTKAGFAKPLVRILD